MIAICEAFRKLADDKEGTIYVDRFEDNVRVLILRGPASLCAYLGIPLEHPLADNDYDDLPIQCNGGLTYGAPGKKGGVLPEGYYWYGWDHAHCDDLCFYDLKYRESLRDSKQWTVEEVEKEIWLAVYGMKKLMKITERATLRGTRRPLSHGREEGGKGERT